MVHAYLMYGYPYQIENDRQFRNDQLFEAGVLQSGFSINLQ
jgi:hypothetical protein